MDALSTTAALATTDLPVDMPALTVTPMAAPTNPTAAQVSTIDCHICVCMNRRKPAWKQAGPSKMCVLCVRQYCTAHAAPVDKVGGEDVCEINHETYYWKHEAIWGEGVHATLYDRKCDKWASY